MTQNIEYVDAVIVTRGDVDLTPIRATLWNFHNIVVWNNLVGPDMGPFGQFLAASYLANTTVVYMQDDDCTTKPLEIIAAWEPGKIVCNMGTQGHVKNYENRLDKLMGFGCCFEKRLIKETFDAYFKKYPIDRIAWREPGRIFTAMNHDKIKVVEVEFQNLPWATGSDRLYKQAEHLEMGNEAIRRVKEILWQTPV